MSKPNKMSTMPHLKQIQSTDFDKHPHLYDEVISILTHLESIESRTVNGVFNTYEEMVGAEKEEGFYKVISDETVGGNPTEYYYTGEELIDLYGVKNILEALYEAESKLEELDWIIRPHILTQTIEFERGQEVIEVELLKTDYTLDDSLISVEGAVVSGVELEGNVLKIDVEPMAPSTHITLKIDEGALKTPNGYKNCAISYEGVSSGEPIKIEHSAYHGTTVDGGRLSMIFPVTIGTKPLELEFNSDKIHTRSGLIDSIEYDDVEKEIHIEVAEGYHSDILFYEGVFVGDRALSEPLICRIDMELKETPDVVIKYIREHPFVLGSGEREIPISEIVDSGISPEDIFNRKYVLSYEGYTGKVSKLPVPVKEFDTFEAPNPQGAVTVIGGSLVFERAVIGSTRFVIGEVEGGENIDEG